jgi:hyperosmotically inducible protein
MKKLFFATVLFLALGITFLPASPQEQTAQMEKDIIHAIAMAPHYGVFDSLSFRLDGNNVTLLGQTMLPITKEEVSNRVSKMTGIGKITNNIEVLPLSKKDDMIRLQVYRSLFGSADLYRYALGPNPSIHIIVKGGHVTLEGLVSNEGDSHFANLAVRRVSGIFSVTNNLNIGK